MFFYFFKIIFDITTSKQYKIYILNFNKKNLIFLETL